MPLPDAKPDRRIYELLKTTDLQSLTFSDFQKVAQTIYAEQGAEDELRRIVLVNLARLSVAGEWTGLTSAGAAGADFGTMVGNVGTYTRYSTADASPWAVGVNTTVTADPSASDDAYGFPFTAAQSGTLSEISLYFSSTASFVIGIYNMDSDGMPSTLVGKATLTGSGTGAIYQTSITGSGGGAAGSLEKGKSYWVWQVRASGASNGNVLGMYNTSRGRMMGSDIPNSTLGGNAISTNYDAASGLPDTWATTGMAPNNSVVPKIFYKVS